MSTGYQNWRAEPHERACEWIVGALQYRGINVVQCDTDGHKPDLLIPPRTYIDVKTGDPNLAIELDSLAEYRRVEARGGRVYIVHAISPAMPATWTVDTPDTVTARIKGGPRRRSGNGSNDDWYLIGRGGSPFAEFFGLIAEAAA